MIDRMIEHDVRWKQRFQNLTRALILLREINDVDFNELKALELEGFSQRFEFTYELLWKTIKDYMEYQGFATLASPRATFKTAYLNGILADNDIFAEIVNARNLLSHTYDSIKFKEILVRVREEFLPAFEKAYATLLEGHL
ncbi:nucleotidyltransferase [Clostridia bacterium]|nr:nucleotidyltransferase [Clostridia bacterium]